MDLELSGEVGRLREEPKKKKKNKHCSSAPIVHRFRHLRFTLDDCGFLVALKHPALGR